MTNGGREDANTEDTGWATIRMEFWQRVYITAMRSGRPPGSLQGPEQAADAALHEWDKRFNKNPRLKGGPVSMTSRELDEACEKLRAEGKPLPTARYLLSILPKVTDPALCEALNEGTDCNDET